MADPAGTVAKRDAERAKARILEASIAVLREVGTGGWTVDAVARRAGCAKGLVHYHFGTKGALLEGTATAVATSRWRRIGSALQLRGSAAIDALWDSVLAAVRSGETRARFGLLAHSGAAAAFAPSPELLEVLAERLRVAFDLGLDELGPEDAALLLAALNGLEMLLLAGMDEAVVRESYHRFLLYLVG